MKKIIITNGSGRCGKDTFAELMNKYVKVDKYSSIDFFKKLGAIGRMKQTKGEKERLLLSVLKKAFVNYNDLPLLLCSEKIEEFLHNIDNDVLIIDIREPEEIEKIISLYPQIITVLLINNNVPIIMSNSSDAGVFDYVYDYVIDNSDTLATLEDSVITFLKELKFHINESEEI